MQPRMESTAISASEADAMLNDWSKNRLTVYLQVVTGLPAMLVTQRKGSIEKLPRGFQHIAVGTTSLIFPENFRVIARFENSEFLSLQFKQRESGEGFMLILFVAKTNAAFLADEFAALSNIIH